MSFASLHIHLVSCPEDSVVFCVDREIPNELHTSTPEFNFFYIDDLASDVLPLLIGSFLVALYLVGIFFDVNLI